MTTKWPSLARADQVRAVALAMGLALVAGACVAITEDSGDSTAGTAVASTDPSIAAAASRAPGVTTSPAVPGSPVASARPTPVPLSADPSIGFISLDSSLPYAQAVAAGIRQSSAVVGLDVVECDANYTPDGTLDCAAELAAAGVHGLVSFQPFPGLTGEICDAIDGRPTVGVVFPQGSCQVSLLTIDQAASGRLAGDAVGAVAEELWACEVNAFISLESNDTDPDGRARMQGYRDGYAQHCPLPDRTIALDGAEHLLTAQTQMTQLMRELKGKPNVVVGLNEDAILGAMAAVDSAGRSGQFWYSGQLADPAIRAEIACNERYVASVAQFPERFGELIVPTLAAAVAGEEVAPELIADLELVTSDNVHELFPDTPACDA